MADSPTPAVRPDAPTKDPLLAKVVGPTPNLGASSSSLGVGAARVSDDGAREELLDEIDTLLDAAAEFAVANRQAVDAPNVLTRQHVDSARNTLGDLKRRFLAKLFALSVSAGAPETSDVEQRVSDYRAGYSAGYQHATVRRPVADEASAALFFNLPVWDVCVRFVDCDGDDELCSHFVTLRADDKATAAELAEEQLRRETPSAVIRSEESEVMPYTPDEPDPAARVSAGAEPSEAVAEAEWRAPMHPPTAGEIEAVVELAQYFETFPPKSRWQFNAIRYAMELARLRAPAPDAERLEKLAVEFAAAVEGKLMLGMRSYDDDINVVKRRSGAQAWYDGTKQAILDYGAALLRERDALAEKRNVAIACANRIGDQLVETTTKLIEVSAKLAAAEQENAALKDELARAAVDLGRYGHHTAQCGFNRRGNLTEKRGPCTCGYRLAYDRATDQAIARSTPIPATADTETT